MKIYVLTYIQFSSSAYGDEYWEHEETIGAFKDQKACLAQRDRKISDLLIDGHDLGNRTDKENGTVIFECRSGGYIYRDILLVKEINLV